IRLGNWSAARAVFKGHEDDPAYQALLNYWASSVPVALQAEILGDGFQATPVLHEYDSFFRIGLERGNRGMAENQKRIQDAEAALNDHNTAEIVAKLDALQLEEAEVDLKGRRAAIYERAGALDKALADVDSLLQARPEQQSANAQRATLLAKKGQFPEAMEAWRAAGVGGLSPMLPFLRALVSHGRIQEAETVLEAIGPAGPHAREVA